jgi:Derlin-2/3
MIISFVFKIFGKIPPITRVLILTMLGMGSLINLEICDQTMFVYNTDLIFRKQEYWRLFTSVLFQHEFGLVSIINAFIFYQYTAGLEENSFRTKSADFFMMILIIFVSLIGISYITEEPIISP